MPILQALPVILVLSVIFYFVWQHRIPTAKNRLRDLERELTNVGDALGKGEFSEHVRSNAERCLATARAYHGEALSALERKRWLNVENKACWGLLYARLCDGWTHPRPRPRLVLKLRRLMPFPGKQSR